MIGKLTVVAFFKIGVPTVIVTPLGSVPKLKSEACTVLKSIARENVMSIVLGIVAIVAPLAGVTEETRSVSTAASAVVACTRPKPP